MKIIPYILTVMALAACSTVPHEPGVSKRLAEERALLLSDVSYRLSFDLTGEKGEVFSTDTVSFILSARKDVAMDFKAPDGSLLELSANGSSIVPDVIDEHIVIPHRFLRKGQNTVAMRFIAGEQSLNRREEFLYTLLVPDRARTLFPCFDQPDLKAEFNLSLEVPSDWCAVSNTAAISVTNEGNREKSSVMIRFAPTEPLSTYLFSFVAGVFERVEASRNGRTISMYHRETDPGKTAQAQEIFDLVFDSLEWLEDYTGIPYPFQKYDFIVLPDFQYGGMEHTGATLYNDRRIFLGSHPTTDELLDRASLIAHETSHMWFGDYVTMRWFNDVWTKEVFANWFAAQIMRPLFPEINHTLSDLRNYYAPAYSEDRTYGSNAIQRPLDNLQDAGLIYCNIIYDKAPVVMDMLARKLGPDKFRSGIRQYLGQFGYSNATWDDLVGILDGLTDDNLAVWSDIWIKEAGMPVYSAEIKNGAVSLVQEDPMGKGREWEQELDYRVAEDRFWIPNVDGMGYGWFKPDAESLEYIMQHWSSFDETARMSLLMTLYENSWHGTLERRRFVGWCASTLKDEMNPLILSCLISSAASEALRCDDGCPEFSESLRELASGTGKSHEIRLLAFRQFFKSASTPQQWEEIYGIWDTQEPYPGLSLGETDYTEMTYQLMTAFPDRAETMAVKQRARITNPDRLEAFDFISRAASPDRTAREEFFYYLLAAPENRRPESRVLSALALLCHRDRQEEAIKYIVPSLEALPQIQRTGDIFFPASWCKNLLSNQQSYDAKKTVDDWLEAHPEMNPLLITKIRQAEGWPAEPGQKKTDQSNN